MFKLIQSPIQRPLNNVILNGCQIPRPTFPRYSSVEEINSKQDSSVNLLRFDILKPQKRGLTIQKTQRSENQRSNSQRKLTLITMQPQNTCYNSSLSTSQNINFLNSKQAYEGYKKNSQLKTLNTTRNAPLQKKSKHTTNKYNYQQKFPTSTSNIKIEGDPVTQQNESDEDMSRFVVKFQKEKNICLGEIDENNNYALMDTQNYLAPVMQTVPNSPVYEVDLKKENSFHSNQTTNNNFVLQYCHQKISQLKDQTQIILMENSKKIKELESLLIFNKQKLQEKDQIIRQLELNFVLRQTSKPQPYSQFSQNILDSPKHFRGNSMDCIINENTPRKNSQQFLNSKVSDLEKKILVISKWFENQQQKINQKIDKMNNFMESFVAIKFHNMKFTLKTFVTKTQQKVNSIIDTITKVEEIVKLNQIDEYERIFSKTKQFVSSIQKFLEIKVPQKVQFDDMKTTINTAIEICKHRPTLSDYQNMVESRQINESFWNNLEDFSQGKHGEESFTDDSFSYAPGGQNNKSPTSNNSSSIVNDFSLRQVPSFSRKVSNDSFRSIRSSLVQIEIGCIKTIEEISKCRQGPLSVYLDPNGNIRYKSSQSYIFDRRGNILKPTSQQIDYCLKMGWITLS